ncbi:MAG TPA: energy transducer TonB [Kofleriaceae bacterium]|jgi:TonB family protein|nr:energy transducer TonB [Kofleriaceae bacterium]
MVGAILAHAAVIAGFAWITIRAPRYDANAASPEPEQHGDVPLSPTPAVTFAFTNVDVARLPLAPVPGAGDAIGDPGDRAGGGGGPRDGAWTGRRDHELTRAEPWNGGDAYRAAHDDTHAPPRTTEAIHRAPDPDTGDRARAQVGAEGESRASVGDATGQGAGTAPQASLDRDPIFDAPAGRTSPTRIEGASRANDRAPYADVGPRAEDVQRHGAPGDDRAVAASSDATHPDPYDLSPSSGGRGAGAPGGAGDGRITVTAAAQDPYLRAFLRKLEDAVVFPKDLARDLRSGRVIASFRLAADGTIRDIRIDVPSAYPAFDAALATGLRQLRSLGPVPRRLLHDAADIRIRVPFTFANPMIR